MANSIGNGVSMPLMIVLYRKLANSFGNSEDIVGVVQEVSKIALRFVYVELGTGVSSYFRLGTPALTTYQCLITTGVKLVKIGPPMNFLVTAASSGVGHYDVHLAKLGNTHVTTTCGTRNAAFVRSLWADEILDYKTPEGKALISPSGRKYNDVVQCTTGFSWSTFNSVLSSKGRVVDITPNLSALATFAMKKLTCSKK
ncbi:quinone-oxidoreductase homolog, chloroplastic-like [Apium graveolens]|uniref:quinone-oxidoreductase homolog, chloroplastic-like n=1 Tax=Apium graveolens TaxID=4045 RepID=UPI003D7A6C96